MRDPRARGSYHRPIRAESPKARVESRTRHICHLFSIIVCGLRAASERSKPIADQRDRNYRTGHYQPTLLHAHRKEQNDNATLVRLSASETRERNGA